MTCLTPLVHFLRHQLKGSLASRKGSRKTLNNIVGMTIVAAHGPPCGTEAAAQLSKQALSNYKSRYGERFCSRSWKAGITSNTIAKLKAKKWDW